jgi:phosphopantothenoylcysteine decarboxylase/phosphopantothenate--cysteine ligase
VRYITNGSSGKTGFALARAAADRGANVTLVTGPVSLEDPAGVTVVRIQSAQDMLNAVSELFDKSDIAIFSAAVCDGRPSTVYERKLKKGSDDQALATIELVLNPDILATMGSRKRPDQVVVGFAAETNDIEENARKKLVAKHADLIVGNDVSQGKGFARDNNEVMLVSQNGVVKLPLMGKDELAHAILDAVVQ